MLLGCPILAATCQTTQAVAAADQSELRSRRCPTMQVAFQRQISQAATVLKVQGMLQLLPRTRLACLQYQGQEVITMYYINQEGSDVILQFHSLNAFIMSARVLECMSARLRYECMQMMQGHGTMSEPDLCLTCVQTMQRYMNSPCKMLQLIQKLLRSIFLSMLGAWHTQRLVTRQHAAICNQNCMDLQC